jgi:hypothetical protein
MMDNLLISCPTTNLQIFLNKIIKYMELMVGSRKLKSHELISFHLFSYIKKEVRDRERNKKQRKEKRNKN